MFTDEDLKLINKKYLETIIICKYISLEEEFASRFIGSEDITVSELTEFFQSNLEKYKSEYGEYGPITFSYDQEFHSGGDYGIDTYTPCIPMIKFYIQETDSEKEQRIKMLINNKRMKIDKQKKVEESRQHLKAARRKQYLELKAEFENDEN